MPEDFCRTNASQRLRPLDSFEREVAAPGGFRTWQPFNRLDDLTHACRCDQVGIESVDGRPLVPLVEPHPRGPEVGDQFVNAVAVQVAGDDVLSR